MFTLLSPPSILTRSSEEPIIGTDKRLCDFWQWGFSDVLSNTTRGILAEYLVSTALGIDTELRITWDPYDLKYGETRIEVKSSAYLQSWNQRKNSAPCFTIRPTRAWDSQTSVLDTEAKRQADLYIFCVLTHTDRATINPLDVAQWDFYILSSQILDERANKQKTMSLSTIVKLGATKSSYSNLKNLISVNK